MSSMFLDYHLPDEKIAQRPIGQGSDRSNSKLLHASIAGNKQLHIENKHYSDLPNILKSGDLLVLNNSKVLPCRFFVKTDYSEIEILFVRSISVASGAEETWEVLARPMKRLKIGKVFNLCPGLNAVAERRGDDNPGRLLLRVYKDNTTETGSVGALLQKHALMPIPPYIRGGHADAQDRETYQNIYAETFGSIAAPTAGFHFTEELFNEFSRHGIEKAYITLHVGTASFTPIRECDVEHHKMDVEHYEITSEVAQKICNAKAAGRRVVVVGTTCLRALEAAVRTPELAFLSGKFGGETKNSQTGQIFKQQTDLFITPGFDFKVADGLITNFHQPKSTHLLLVASFVGEENAAKIYQHALNSNYRFLSYGDGMLLDRKE